MTKKHNGIARIDQESKNSHGWFARVTYQRKTKGKFFSDRKHGGHDIALELAITWRNTIKKRLGKIRTEKMVVTCAKSTNGTGVVGVRLNEEYNRYEVSWVTPEGKQGKTSINISKHGKDAAFVKACTLRYEKEQERLGG